MDAPERVTIHRLSEGGGFRVPVDTGIGNVGRSQMAAARGGNAATLETLYDFFIDSVPDPDEAMALDPNIRERIRMHPDVQAAFLKRQLTVSSFPWRIEANEDASNKTEAEFVAKYVTWAFKQIPGKEKLFAAMQKCVIDGGVGLEWTWHSEANGVERPVLWQNIDKTRFGRDRLGNLALKTRGRPVWGNYVAADPTKSWFTGIPEGKFNYHTFLQEAGPWGFPQLEGYRYWGLGLDVSLYYVVTFDYLCLKYRMQYLRNYSSPPVDLYYPDNGPYSQLLGNIATSVNGRSVTTIPKPVGKEKNFYYEPHYREVPHGSYDFFEGFNDRYTVPRASALILGSSDEMHRTEHGGFSDQTARQDSGPNVIFRWDARNIAETLTTQLIRWIALARFPHLPASFHPRLVLEPKEEKDRQQEAGVLTSASKLGLKIPEAAAYEALGIQKPSGDEPTIGGEAEKGDGPAGGPPGVPADPRKAPLTVPGPIGARMRGADRTRPSTPIGSLPPQVPGRRR